VRAFSNQALFSLVEPANPDIRPVRNQEGAGSTTVRRYESYDELSLLGTQEKARSLSHTVAE